MSIESTLTRKLDIRFIDARAISNEAKLNLGIIGYHNRDEDQRLIEEAIRIFEERSIEEQCAMKKLKGNLDAFKLPTTRRARGSLRSHRRSHTECDADSIRTATTNTTGELSIQERYGRRRSSSKPERRRTRRNSLPWKIGI